MAKICFIPVMPSAGGSGHAQCSHRTGLWELGFQSFSQDLTVQAVVYKPVTWAVLELEQRSWKEV